MNDVKINPKRVRFSDADWFEGINSLDVIVGGLGSLGSWLCLYLTRVGVNIYGFDMDTVDEVNMAGQLYKNNDIGEFKTESLRTTLREFGDYNNDLDFENIKYEANSMATSVMFSCFDNMKARKDMFENWCNYIRSDGQQDIYKIFIDARLTAETFEVFAVTPDKIEEYKKTLFTDAESDELPCSFKSTTHVAAMASGIMFTCLTNHISNVTAGFELKELPLKISYSGQLFMLEIQSNIE